MALDWTYLSFAALGAFLVGLSKGGLSTTGVLAVPILSLVMSPLKAASLLLPIYIVSDIVGVWLYRKSFSIWNIKVLIPGGLLGILIGWAMATVISDKTVAFLIGVMGVVFCLNNWLRKGPVAAVEHPSVAGGLFWGGLTGFTSFISHSGSPPFQVYVLPQKLPKAEFAGTATLVFAVFNLAKVVPYQDLRPYSAVDMSAALVLVPFAIGGTFVGAYLTRRIPDGLFFRLIQIGLFAVSLKLIWGAVGASVLDFLKG